MSEFLKIADSKGLGRFDNKAQMEKKFAEIFSDSAPFTQNNIAFPQAVLSEVMTTALEVILERTSADEVIGEKNKVIEWESTNSSFPLIEVTGSTQPYADFGESRYGDLNTNWVDFKQYRFETGIKIGDLETKQYARARIDAVARKYAGASENIRREFNRIAYYGALENSNLLVYGLLNNPELSAYETISKTWDQSTYGEIKADIEKLLTVITKNAKGNFDATKEKIRVALPPVKLMYLSATETQYAGVFLLDQLKKVFPNLEFVSAPELAGAETSQDVIVMQAINGVGGVENPLEQGYSELARMSAIEQKHFGYTQAMCAGSAGCLAYKPMFVVRAKGV